MDRVPRRAARTALDLLPRRLDRQPRRHEQLPTGSDELEVVPATNPAPTTRTVALPFSRAATGRRCGSARAGRAVSCDEHRLRERPGVTEDDLLAARAERRNELVLTGERHRVGPERNAVGGVAACPTACPRPDNPPPAVKLATKTSGDELTLSSVTASAPSPKRDRLAGELATDHNPGAVDGDTPSVREAILGRPAVAHAIVPSAANMARKHPHVNCGAVNDRAAGCGERESRRTADAEPARTSTATSRAWAKGSRPPGPTRSRRLRVHGDERSGIAARRKCTSRTCAERRRSCEDPESRHSRVVDVHAQPPVLAQPAGIEAHARSPSGPYARGTVGRRRPWAEGPASAPRRTDRPAQRPGHVGVACRVHGEVADTERSVSPRTQSTIRRGRTWQEMHRPAERSSRDPDRTTRSPRPRR